MHNRWEAISDYLEAVIQDAPGWVYGIALGFFIVGSAIAFIKKGRNEGVRVSARLFLLFYVIVMFCLTVFFRTTTTIKYPSFHFFWHYRVYGQKWNSLFPEIILNMAVFVPIGFALGLAFRKPKGWLVVLVGMGISVSIELLQWFFMKGFADVDDVMHNTFGCVMGCLLYFGMRRVVFSGRKVIL